MRPKILNAFMLNRESYRVPRLASSIVYRTCGYALNRDIAVKLLNVTETNFYLIDDWFQLVLDTGIDGLFIQKLISHLLDLSLSSIEQERLEIEDSF